MNPAEFALRAGNPREALAALSDAVRAAPGDASLRVFLVQLLCVLGEWKRAHTQLNVAAGLDESVGPMREMVGHALRCEQVRAAVFEGRKPPMVFGHPDPWLAMLVESLLQAGQGQIEQAAGLADRAFDAAPATPGTLDGAPFQWIADADSRLGPVLEAMVNGRYYWVPFQRLASVVFEKPVDLRDMVWLPAYLTFANGGESVALVPVRYSGTEASSDGQLQLARRTEWVEISPERWRGLGQRVLTTDQGEHGLLDIRRIELQPPPETEAT